MALYVVRCIRCTSSVRSEAILVLHYLPLIYKTKHISIIFYFIVDARKWIQAWPRILRENKISIVSFLNLDNGTSILIQLVSYGVLNNQEEDEINSVRTKAEKNVKFLDIIQQKEWTEIPKIIAAIRETQKPMADIIEELYSKAIQESIN